MQPQEFDKIEIFIYTCDYIKCCLASNLQIQ